MCCNSCGHGMASTLGARGARARGVGQDHVQTQIAGISRRVQIVAATPY